MRVAGPGLLLVAAGLWLGSACDSGPAPCTEEGGALSASGHLDAAGAHLACSEVGTLESFAGAIASRPLDMAARDRFRTALAGVSDVAALRTIVAHADTVLAGLRAGPPVERAERRSAELYRVVKGTGPWSGAGLETLRSHLRRHAGPWYVDDTEALVLGEQDIEGWIHFASLCREVQGASPLTVSVADRVSYYRVATERWKAGDRRVKLALLSMGPFWQAARSAWLAASYDEQQAWIAGAPLPAPMVGLSAEYFQTVMAGDLPGHVTALHAHLGPLAFEVPP